jgi:ADP-ribose pyrophosphatase
MAGQMPSANCHVLLYIVPMPKTSKRKARVLSTRTVFRGKVFFVTSDEVLEPSHIRARRDIVRHPGSVVVLAIDESRPEVRVLLEHQYRYAAQQFLWELPAGRVDEGEAELIAAKRELLEETGYTAHRWQLALRYYASPGFMDETMAIYLARDLRSGKAQPEHDEAIRIRLVSVSDVVHKIVSGKIRDGKTIAGVLWFEKYMAQKPA